MKNRIANIGVLAYWLLIALICVAFCYVLSSFPYAMDDWQFKYRLDNWGLYRTFRFLFFVDNNRIGNFLSVLLLYIPRIYARILECAGFIVGFLLMIKVAGIKPGQWRKLSFMAFLMIFAVMWEEYMFSQPFAFNYILDIPLLFGMIYLYFNPSKAPLWVGITVGVILGMWHESYAMVFLSGAVLTFIFCRRTIERKQVIYFAAVLIGFTWILTNRLIWTRHEDLVSFSFANFKRLAFIWGYFLYVLIWLIAMACRRYRRFALSPFMIFSLGGFITLPFVVFYLRNRGAMPAILVSCCTLTVLIGEILNGRHRKVVTCISAVLYSIIICHLTAVCITTARIMPRYNKLCEIIAEAGPGQKYVFAPVLHSFELPAAALSRPIEDGIDPRSSLAYSTKYRFLPPLNTMIVPDVLEDYKEGYGEPLTDDGHIRRWKNCIVSSEVKDSAYHAVYTIYEHSFNPEFSHHGRTVFRGADGKDYVYINPARSRLSRFMGKPIHIEIVK